MSALISIIVSVIIISLASLVGILFVSIKELYFNRILSILVALASGCLIGAAFFHLIPESLSLGIETVFLLVIVGLLLFFVMEKFLNWRHCHDKECDEHPKPFVYMNLVGDSIHNFLDGLVIAAAYMINFPLGLTTSLAILAHEIPQEIGDYAVLVYGGIKKKRALFYNFLTALTAIIGAIVGFFLYKSLDLTFVLPIVAGSFLYIATSDLIPELHKKSEAIESIMQFIFILIGITLMFALKFLH